MPSVASAASLPLAILTRTEVRIGVRGAAFRVAVAAALLLGWSVGNAPGRGVALSAYATGEAGWQYLGFLAVVWMSLAAVRDSVLRTDILVYSKPQPTERLALAKFLGSFAQLLLILLALFAGAALSRAIVGGGLSGFPAYGLQYVRVAGVLFFAGALSYSLALLADSAVAGSLIGLYWVVAMSGKSFLSKAYYPALTQNLPAYVLFGLAVLVATLWFYRRRRRGAAPVPFWIPVLAPLALVLGAWSLWTAIRDGHDPQARLQPLMETMAGQTATRGYRAPGFILPDQYGRERELSDFPDRILVIALWSPRETESAFVLSLLSDLKAKYGARGVQPIAMCLSEDAGAGATFARGENLAYPLVSDWGTYNAPVGSAMSPLADAYKADMLPMVIITDRRRRVRETISGVAAYNATDMRTYIEERLAEEPE